MNETLVGEALADHPTNGHVDKAHGAGFARILAERKLVNVAVKVLLAHEVVDAVVAALQQRPEAFDAVGMDAVVADIFASRVIDGVVNVALAGETAVGRKLVGNDACTLRHISFNEARKRPSSGVGKGGGANLCIIVADADNGSFADAAPAKVKALGGVLVLLFAADEGFIDLDMIAHVIVGASQPSFADALCEEPCRLLGDAQFAGHLGRRDALARRRHHVDRHKPLVQRQAAFCEHGAGADAEMLAAVTAAVGHRLVVLDLGDRQAATVGARDFTGPAIVLEVKPSSVLVGEASEELVEADGFRLFHVIFPSVGR